MGSSWEPIGAFPVPSHRPPEPSAVAFALPGGQGEFAGGSLKPQVRRVVDALLDLHLEQLDLPEHVRGHRGERGES